MLEEHAARYDYDIRATGKALQEEQERIGGKLVLRAGKKETIKTCPRAVRLIS